MIAILHQDDDLIVVDKPSGLLTVPGRTPDLADCLIFRLQEQMGERIYLVHRLDRDTSGIVLLARNHPTQRWLSKSFELRKTNKEYTALVTGELPDEAGTIDLPMGKDWSIKSPPTHKVDHDKGRPATTHWEVLERSTGRTRLLLKPMTGRSHQLRVHLRAIGHPIVGDPIYGDASGTARMCLHASMLNFRHPGGEWLTVHCPCPF